MSLGKCRITIHYDGIFVLSTLIRGAARAITQSLHSRPVVFYIGHLDRDADQLMTGRQNQLETLCRDCRACIFLPIFLFLYSIPTQQQHHAARPTTILETQRVSCHEHRSTQARQAEGNITFATSERANNEQLLARRTSEEEDDKKADSFCFCDCSCGAQDILIQRSNQVSCVA
jgi:hypothetical protein